MKIKVGLRHATEMKKETKDWAHMQVTLDCQSDDRLEDIHGRAVAEFKRLYGVELGEVDLWFERHGLRPVIFEGGSDTKDTVESVSLLCDGSTVYVAPSPDHPVMFQCVDEAASWAIRRSKKMVDPKRVKSVYLHMLQTFGTGGWFGDIKEEKNKKWLRIRYLRLQTLALQQLCLPPPPASVSATATLTARYPTVGPSSSVDRPVHAAAAASSSIHRASSAAPLCMEQLAPAPAATTGSHRASKGPRMVMAHSLYQDDDDDDLNLRFDLDFAASKGPRMVKAHSLQPHQDDDDLDLLGFGVDLDNQSFNALDDQSFDFDQMLHSAGMSTTTPLDLDEEFSFATALVRGRRKRPSSSLDYVESPPPTNGSPKISRPETQPPVVFQSYF